MHVRRVLARKNTTEKEIYKDMMGVKFVSGREVDGLVCWTRRKPDSVVGERTIEPMLRDGESL